MGGFRTFGVPNTNTVESFERPFATGNIGGTGNVAGTATFLGGTFRGPQMIVNVNGPVSLVRFLYRNFNVNDTAGPAAYTFQASAEVGTDQATSLKYPLFFNGSRICTLQPGSQVWSDWVSIDVKRGDALYSRTFMTVPVLGSGYGSSFVTSQSLGEGYDISDTVPVDKSDSATITPRNSANAWGPVLAIGSVQGKVPVTVGAIGDSIISGVGDELMPILFRGGWLVRGLNGRVPLVQASASGLTANGSRLVYRGRSHLCATQKVITAYGVNDFASNSAATVMGWLVTEWRSVAAMGVDVYQATITPVTTSTNNWQSPSDQTWAAGSADKIIVNQWLRAGAPINSATFAPISGGSPLALRVGQPGHPLKGILDVASEVESSLNSGLWVDGTTADGTHPNSAGAILMGSALTNLAVLGL